MATEKQISDYRELLLQHFGEQSENSDTNITTCCKTKFTGGCMNDHTVERNFYEKTFEDKCASLLQYKKEGDLNYCNKKYQESKEFYKKALLLSELAISENEAEESKLIDLKILLHLNLSISLMQLFKYDKAIESLDYVLSKSENNEKAIYRKLECLQKLKRDKELKLFYSHATKNKNLLNKEFLSTIQRFE